MTKDFNMWQLAIWHLLAFFESMEGTTYLHEKTNQESFLEEVDEEIRDRVEEVLKDYHVKNSMEYKILLRHCAELIQEYKTHLGKEDAPIAELKRRLDSL